MGRISLLMQPSGYNRGVAALAASAAAKQPAEKKRGDVLRHRPAGLPEVVSGGAEGDRTLDLRIANATLSQLSYRPTIASIGSARGREGGDSSIQP